MVEIHIKEQVLREVRKGMTGNVSLSTRACRIHPALKQIST